MTKHVNKDTVTLPALLTAITLGTALMISGCAPQSTDSLADDDDPEVLLTESAVSSVNSALNDSEQSVSYAFERTATPRKAPGLYERLIPSAYAKSCGRERFSPSIGSANCLGTEENKTVIATFDSCSVGRMDEFTMLGTIKLSFDSAQTCDEWIQGNALPTSGYVTRTTSSVLRKNKAGATVTSNSDIHQNYQGETLGGGVKTLFSADSRSIDILGIHRVRSNPRGKIVFDHSISTPVPLVVTGTRADGNRRVSSGIIQVDHNRNQFSVTTEMSGLVWDSSCCHPVAGEISWKLSGSKTGTTLVKFDSVACGQAKVTRADGSEVEIELSSCE